MTDFVSHYIVHKEDKWRGSEQTNQRIRDQQRAKILEAAKAVFANKGLAATMDDIAREAAVSHGLAYRYFASKETLFAALVEQAIQQGDRLHEFEQYAGSPGERLCHFVTALFESRRDPRFHQLLAQVLASKAAPSELRTLIQQRAAHLHDYLRQMIVVGQALGEVAAGDPDQMVRAILAAADGLVRWATYDPLHHEAYFPDPQIFLRMLKP